jgi:hypothetical protein
VDRINGSIIIGNRIVDLHSSDIHDMASQPSGPPAAAPAPASHAPAAPKVKSEPWIKMPDLPLVGTIFLPTAPVPKSTLDVDFATALAPCVRKGHEAAVAPLLQVLAWSTT